MPVSPDAAPSTPPARRVSFHPDLIAHESPIGMSLQHVANRARPNMKFVRLVLGQAQRNIPLDTATAQSALLAVYNFNQDAPFLAPEDAERVEQHIAEARRPPLAPYETRYHFLREVLAQAWAAIDAPRQCLALFEVIKAGEQGRRIPNADAADALLAILLMDDRLGLLTDNEACHVEESLQRAYYRQRSSPEEQQFLCETAKLALNGRRGA